jgi:hypothetical protein
MPVSQITFTDQDKVLNFEQMLARFAGGWVYIGEGSYADASEADSAFADQTALDTELSTNLSKISDLADDPGKEESTVEKHKTMNYVIEGKRENTVELNLVGLTQERKDWLENELNRSKKTIALVTKDRKDVLLFNGLRWAYERNSSFNGEPFSGTISSQFSGLSNLMFRIYKDIPESGV